MNRTAFRRALALLGILLIGAQPLMGALAEAGDIVSEPVEYAVGEEAAFALAADTLGDGADEAEAPETDEPETDAPETDAPETDAPAGEDAADGEARAFDGTVEVGTEAWQDVNLTRAEGFEGKLAVVTGRLTLTGVTIEGVPAGEVNLLDYFELGPTGSIVVGDDAQLALSLSAFSFNKGQGKTLSLKWNGKSLSAKKATWKTSNSKVAKVSNKGKVTAKGKGTATITAKYKKVKAVCRVAVTNIIYPSSVKLNKSSLTLSLYNSKALKATVKPANAVDTTVTWTSSNPAIVSVDENGTITGLAKGKATIKAVACNGKTGSCKVTVKEILPKKLDFSQLYVTLHPGDSFQTAAVMSPADVSNPQVNYSSDNPAVANVDGDGIVTANGIGTATITAVAASKTSVRNTCKVCVIAEGAARMEGVIIGINPGHQIKTISKLYPLAPGSSKKAKGVKTGACGRWTRVNEYETVLQVGLKLKRILEDYGATVAITRTTNNVMLTNIDRAKMLNAAGVDVAIQLHCNSSRYTSHKGCSGYIRTTGSWVAESRALAKAITKNVSASTGCVNLGVKVQNGYMSLNWTTTPTLLLEMGYLSNKTEDKLLATDAYREKMAYGIAEGLCQYFGR